MFEEYVTYDSAKPTETVLSNTELVSLVGSKPAPDDKDGNSDEESTPPLPATTRETTCGMESALLYMENQGFAAEDIDVLRGLTRKVNDHNDMRARCETDLLAYFRRT